MNETLYFIFLFAFITSTVFLLIAFIKQRNTLKTLTSDFAKVVIEKASVLENLNEKNELLSKTVIEKDNALEKIQDLEENLKEESELLTKTAKTLLEFAEQEDKIYKTLEKIIPILNNLFRNFERISKYPVISNDPIIKTLTGTVRSSKNSIANLLDDLSAIEKTETNDEKESDEP